MVAMDGVCMEGCKDWKLLGIPTGENYVNQVNRKSHFAHFKVMFNEIAFFVSGRQVSDYCASSLRSRPHGRARAERHIGGDVDKVLR